MGNALDGLRQGSFEDAGPCLNLPPKHRMLHCGRAEAPLERLPSTGRKDYFLWSSPEVTHASCWAARREFAPESCKRILALNERKQSVLGDFILCFFKSKNNWLKFTAAEAVQGLFISWQYFVTWAGTSCVYWKADFANGSMIRIRSSLWHKVSSHDF